jgi:hypothetical protein
MRSRANETSFFVFANLNYVIVALTIETLFDFVIIDKVFTYDIEILVKKLVSNQMISLLDVVNLHNQRKEFFVTVVNAFRSNHSRDSQT